LFYYKNLLFLVPTLVQLLKDIETSEEIVEYVQPYIGSVTKAREFAKDFISKRKQLANVEVNDFVVFFISSSITFFSLSRFHFSRD
jgi:hypothetical protein